MDSNIVLRGSCPAYFILAEAIQAAQEVIARHHVDVKLSPPEVTVSYGTEAHKQALLLGGKRFSGVPSR